MQGGLATDAEHAEFHERTEKIVDAILEAPAEHLFIIHEVDVEIPRTGPDLSVGSVRKMR
ncbi:hypothetical protein [Methanoculleus chikugoensis]|uniref:hypothetical protein n=1 Tax=Methanoculleus chikugoensis TaxID=118126 RepID=UPI000ACECFC8|nr:hypothetical protein [Methanoculleus chikugoensis]